MCTHYTKTEQWCLVRNFSSNFIIVCSLFKKESLPYSSCPENIWRFLLCILLKQEKKQEIKDKFWIKIQILLYEVVAVNNSSHQNRQLGFVSRFVDAYLYVPVCSHFHKYLWNSLVPVSVSLQHFGLSTSPMSFQDILQKMTSYCHLAWACVRGVPLLGWLHVDCCQLSTHGLFTRVINWAKGNLIPTKNNDVSGSGPGYLEERNTVEFPSRKITVLIHCLRQITIIFYLSASNCPKMK